MQKYLVNYYYNKFLTLLFCRYHLSLYGHKLNVNDDDEEHDDNVELEEDKEEADALDLALFVNASTRF
jgi:hypothetical protein